MSKPMFTDTSWRTVDELKAALIKAGENLEQEEKTEVERKWAISVENGPNLAHLFESSYYLTDIANYTPVKSTGLTKLTVKHHIVFYVSTDPEIRIRATYDKFFNMPTYYLAYKGPADESGIERIEIEFETTQDIFNRLHTMAMENVYPFLGSVAIQRTVWIAEYDDGLTYELKTADHGNDWQLEIEFPNQTLAKNYVLKDDIAPYITADVTADPFYKIKEYWKRTRISFPPACACQRGSCKCGGTVETGHYPRMVSTIEGPQADPKPPRSIFAEAQREARDELNEKK